MTMSSYQIFRLLLRSNCGQQLLRSASVMCRQGNSHHSTTISTQHGLLHLKKEIISNQWISTTPCFAKGKDRGKDKKKVKGKQVFIDENLLSQLTNLDKLKTDFQECIDMMKEDFIKNLSLRSSTGAIESLPVKVDGDEYQVQDLAQINRKNPKTIVMKMDSFPQAIPAVLEALTKSGMDLNPQQDGTTIFIPVPKVTKEHREMLSKNARTLFIKYRDRIKDVQNSHIKKIRNKELEGGFSVDQIHEAVEMVTNMAQTHISQAEAMLSTKQSELLKS
nr:PREDICTED: ribosome-recycling factor, mitochondrial isoform X1 [Bemisia tabaci]